MELLKGIQQSVSLEKIPLGGYPFARNVVVSAKYRDVANEDGFSKIKQLEGRIIGVIPANDTFIIFSYNSTNGKSEISHFDSNNNYTCIIKDAALNFSTLNMIEGVATYNFKSELIIAWWEGLRTDANVPRILNINCLPFKLNVDCSLVNPSDIDLLNLFAYINSPQILLTDVKDNGGSLASGVYMVAVAYKLPDGNYSNFTSYSQWISIYDDPTTFSFSKIDGCEANTFTTKSIKIKIQNLLTNYTSISIAIIKRIGGIVSAIRFDDVPINNTSIDFNYANDINAINTTLEAILVPTETYTRVKTGTVLDGRLYLANLIKLSDFDYQPYANNIKLKWIRVDIINLAKYQNSYKNPIFIFNTRGFKTNEVYSFYIVFKLKDGTWSEAYHIPGTDIGLLAAYGNLPENSTLADLSLNGYAEPEGLEYLSIDPNVRYHEVYSTAKSDGTMGFFENQDETYPDSDCFDIKDSSGIIGTLRNKKIRHHRFPSIEQLQSWGNNYYTPSSGSAIELLVSVLDKETIGSGNNWLDGTDANKADFDVNSINPAYFTATQLNDDLILTVNQNFTGQLSMRVSWKAVATIRVFGTIERVATGNSITLLNATGGGSVIPEKDEVSISETYQFYTGDTINLSVFLPNASIPKPNISMAVGVIIDNFNDSNGSSKVLGFTFEDVYIPDEIKNNIVGYTFCYAERNASNSLKICQTPHQDIPDALGKTHKLWSFDLTTNKPEVTVDYIKSLGTLSLTPIPLHNNTLFSPLVIDLEVRKINKFSYLPADVSIPYENEENGEIQVIETQNTLTEPLTVIRMGELYTYRKNVYTDYTKQKLVPVNAFFDINTNSTVTPIYGGDTFINLTGFNGNYGMVIEANANAALRHDDAINNYTYYPKYTEVVNPAPIFDDYYGYNADYSALNTLLVIVPFKCRFECADIKSFRFPYRIARSTILNAESNTVGWRKFLTNEYKELLSRDKGEIWKLATLNKALIIYQKYSMFVAAIRDIIANNGVDIYLGQTDIFDREPDEMVPDGVGYIGNQSQWATVTCIHGIIHIDAPKGRIFLFTGKIEEISKKGVEHYLRDFGRISNDLDNPVLGNGYVATFDERYNRLIICKRTDNPFTLSYSFDFGYWIAWHDYFPTLMWFTRVGMYVSDLPFGVGGDYIWKHAVGLYGKYTTFSDIDLQITYRSFIEAIIAEPFELQKQGVSIYWLSTVFDEDGNELYNETYTHAMVYTRTQNSGEITLIKDKTLIKENNNIRNAEFQWRLNDFRDLVKNKDLRNLDDNGVLIPSNIDAFKAWFKRSKFNGRYFVIRLIYNNLSGYQILLKDVNHNYRKLQR